MLLNNSSHHTTCNSPHIVNAIGKILLQRSDTESGCAFGVTLKLKPPYQYFQGNKIMANGIFER